MDHIETAILNCYGIREAEQNMVFAARLTQHGHTIQSMADLMDLYHQSYSQKTVENIAGLPHPTVQKFMVITVAVVGASRRFLAQITRHQNEVKYMPAAILCRCLFPASVFSLHVASFWDFFLYLLQQYQQPD